MRTRYHQFAPTHPPEYYDEDETMTDRPKRVQLSRKKGWRKPEGCVVVARPTKWGNPFNAQDAERVGYKDGRKMAVWAFRAWLRGALPCYDLVDRRRVILRDLQDLRGKDLACWCPLDAPCHADVLLEMAND